MKTHEDAVRELLEFCLANNHHPSELIAWTKLNTKKGKTYEGLNPHALLQDTRRRITFS